MDFLGGSRKAIVEAKGFLEHASTTSLWLNNLNENSDDSELLESSIPFVN